MMQAFALIEQTPPSLFMREDFYAYFAALILHAWGMAMLIGAGVMLALRILGLASAAPLHRFAMLVPIMWAGAALALLSGLALLAGYPAKALTNWIFALKFILLAAAAICVRQMARRVFVVPPSGTPAAALPSGIRPLAALSIALWLGAVAAGKLLLYTNTMLLTSD